MSGLPKNLLKGNKIIISNYGVCTIKDSYCTPDRNGVHNSDEYVVITDRGKFNLSDVEYQFVYGD